MISSSKSIKSRNEDSIMIENRQQQSQEDEEEDPFLRFVDYARSLLSPENNDSVLESSTPSWSWIVSRILKTCIAYSSGVTAAILLSDLSLAWSEQRRFRVPKKMPEWIEQLKKKNRRTKLVNTVTIDSIYEKNFLSTSSVLEAVVVDAFVLPGTNIYMLTLGDFWSSNNIDLYLHRRYYDLVDPCHGILRKGREVFLTGCYLRTAAEGSGYPRLLPTEYIVILLDEDQDDDAMLLGAQFCSDSFSSISLDAFTEGASYSLYARIESMGSPETQAISGCVQKKQIILVDNDGVKMKFLLWGEQLLLANLFSVGNMLALDKPYIASSVDDAQELCLEYGSATQIYMVPVIQHEEQVSISLTQNRCLGSRMLSTYDPSQGPKVSQLTLPCDSQGSVDFRNYPFRAFITDLHDKMTGISLYGCVTDILWDENIAKTVFRLRIRDTTGSIWVTWKIRSWPHHIYLWLDMLHDKTKAVTGAAFVNLSCLPAMLNSSCLHKLSLLADLSKQNDATHICQVWLDQVEYYHVNTRLSHSLCGHFLDNSPSKFMKCNFCHCACDSEVVNTFHLKITIADESTKIFAWCTGETASELLQISPDEFCELTEEEQIMYFSSLENERFIVAIVNCQRQVLGPRDGQTQEYDDVAWEITRAQKCE
ncbi:Cell division control protein 24, OB domain 2 [Dillenia turbinata]|uniref:Cell division control protein 24, OB domain 2 n=1 Tax=Dillenia turbinata TaxID=194707 RepID=A0AAN8VIX3_9MAGN